MRFFSRHSISICIHCCCRCSFSDIHFALCAVGTCLCDSVIENILYRIDQIQNWLLWLAASFFCYCVPVSHYFHAIFANVHSKSKLEQFNCCIRMHPFLRDKQTFCILATFRRRSSRFGFCVFHARNIPERLEFGESCVHLFSISVPPPSAAHIHVHRLGLFLESHRSACSLDRCQIWLNY